MEIRKIWCNDLSIIHLNQASMRAHSALVVLGQKLRFAVPSSAVCVCVCGRRHIYEELDDVSEDVSCTFSGYSDTFQVN